MTHHLRLLLIGALTIAADALAAPIVGTEEVEAALARGALIWDVRADEDYRKGHIPGAVNIDDILVQLRDAKTEDYLPVAQLQQLLGDAGIDPAREIVLYGAKAGTGPYFGLITMQWLGGARASVYHGGIDDWKAAGKPTATSAACSAFPSRHMLQSCGSGPAGRTSKPASCTRQETSRTRPISSGR